MRYRPLADPDRPGARSPGTRSRASATRVAELRAEGPGDILVFLSGEREIRDTADALAAGRTSPAWRCCRCTPGCPRPSSTACSSRTGGRRRVVLATNVAETSLTVPGIKYVIDPGTARISRYSQRTKVQRLPIEPVSQASANQRKGRCGRTSDGICIRLYSEEDFAAGPSSPTRRSCAPTWPRSSCRWPRSTWASMADFPFVDPPESRNIADGVRLLEELGAFPSAGRARNTPAAPGTSPARTRPGTAAGGGDG